MSAAAQPVLNADFTRLVAVPDDLNSLIDWAEDYSYDYCDICSGHFEVYDRSVLLTALKEQDADLLHRVHLGVLQCLVDKHTGLGYGGASPAKDAESLFPEAARLVADHYPAMEVFARQEATDHERRRLQEEADARREAMDRQRATAAERALVASMHVGQKVILHSQVDYEAEVVKLNRQKVVIHFVRRNGKVQTRTVSPLELTIP